MSGRGFEEFELPQPLTAGGALNLPERVGELSDQALGLAEQVQRGFILANRMPEVVVDELNTRETGSSTAVDAVLTDLVENGTISPDEEAFIYDYAERIDQLLSSSTNGYNEFGSLFFRHSNTERSTRRVRRMMTQRDDATIVQTARTIAQKGKRLTSPELIESLELPISAFIQDSTGSLDIDMLDAKSLAILRTMLTLDVVTHVHNLPPEIASTHVSPESKLELAMRHLTENNDMGMLALLYSKNPFRLTGGIKKPYRESVAQTTSLLDTYAAIEHLKQAQVKAKLLLSQKIHGANTLFWQTLVSATQQLEQSRTALLGEAKTFFDEQPSAERMLGALAVEDWVATLDAILDVHVPYKYRSQTELRPLQLAVRTEEDRRKQEIVQQKIDKCREQITDIEQKYAVTSKQLRTLPGGTTLVRNLTALEEAGSQIRIFDRDSARQLAGLSLDGDKTAQLGADVSRLRQVWLEMSSLEGGTTKRGALLQTIDTLLELHESASHVQLTDTELQPIWSLATRLTQPHVQVDPEEAPIKQIKPGPEEIDQAFPNIKFIEAFPPAPTERELKEDFQAIVGQEDSHPVEWERITQLIHLRQDLENEDYFVVTYRLVQTKWHPLPHYVLEVTGKRGTIAIVESPIYANATYIITTPEWQEAVTVSKQDAREVLEVAVPKVHAAGKSLREHRAKLLDETKKRV